MNPFLRFRMPNSRGEANKGCKHGEAKAREIIGLLKQGNLSIQKIANQVGVSRGLVEGIKNGRRWRSLTGR